MKVIEDKMYKHLDDLRMVFKSSLKTRLPIGGLICQSTIDSKTIYRFVESNLDESKLNKLRGLRDTEMKFKKLLDWFSNECTLESALCFIYDHLNRFLAINLKANLRGSSITHKR